MSKEIPRTESFKIEQYRNEALTIAQRISQKWKNIDKGKLPRFPHIEDIVLMDKKPKTGIQVWFEEQIRFIDTAAGTDDNAKSRMMFRLVEDLKRFENDINKMIDNKE